LARRAPTAGRTCNTRAGGLPQGARRPHARLADYAGNRQYITVGNLSENDRVMLFLIDYERGRRLKIWAAPQ